MSRLDELDEAAVKVDAPKGTITPRVLDERPLDKVGPTTSAQVEQPLRSGDRQNPAGESAGLKPSLLEAILGHYGFVRHDASPQESTADKKKEKSRKDRTPVKTWAIPLLSAAAVLLLIFSLGVVFGVLLSHGSTPVIAHIATVAHLPGGILLAPLLAPAGVVLLLLAALYAWARGQEQQSSMWNLLGWMFIALFVLGIF